MYALIMNYFRLQELSILFASEYQLLISFHPLYPSHFEYHYGSHHSYEVNSFYNCWLLLSICGYSYFLPVWKTLFVWLLT